MVSVDLHGTTSNYVAEDLYCQSSNGASWSNWSSSHESSSMSFGGQTIQFHDYKLIYITNGFIATKHNLGTEYRINNQSQYVPSNKAPKGYIDTIEASAYGYWTDSSGHAYDGGHTTVTFYLLTVDPRTLNASQIASQAIRTQTVNIQQGYSYGAPHGNDYGSVRFTGLSLQTRTTFYIVRKYNGTIMNTDLNCSPKVIYEQVSTEASVSPAVVIAGNKVNIQFSNRWDDTIGTKFYYSSKLLHSLDVSNDAISVICPRSWFVTAGKKSSNEIPIRVEFTDPSMWPITPGNFTLQAYSLTITSPTSLMVGDSFVAKVNGKTSGDTITVRFKYNDILLHQQVMSGDTISVVCQKTWFTTAGVSANNALPVTVTFTDQDGKTLTAPLTVNAPKLSITGDKNQVVTNNRINFTIGNRNIQPGDNTALNYRILYGSQVITSNSSLQGDSVYADCEAAWFDDMGVKTSKTMDLTAVVEDAIGRSASYTFTLKAGSEMAPTLSKPTTTLIQAAKAVAAFPDIYIAGYSKSKITIEIQTNTAAGISDVSVTYGGTVVKMSRTSKPAQNRYVYEVVTPSPLNGNTKFTITVQDQRGFQKTATVSVKNVYPYTKPSFTVNKLYRCDEDGEEDAGGEFFKFRANARYADQIPGNSITRFRLAVTGGNSHDISSGTTHQFPTEHGTRKFSFVVSIRDELEETSSSYTVVGGISLIDAYNRLVTKYKPMNDALEYIPLEIIGYPALMEAYYNTVDMELFLTSQMMPNIAISTTDAAREAEKLSAMASSPVAVANLQSCTEATAESAIIGMARCYVRDSYQVKIENGTYNSGTGVWTGSLRVTNYGDEEDTAITQQLTIHLNNDEERYIRQKLNIAMVRESDDVTDTAGLFGLPDDDFAEELNKYGLSSLVGFREACQACLDIMIQNGVGQTGGRSGLYDRMYVPYINKMQTIEDEILERQKEIYIVTGRIDERGNVIVPGMQTVLLEESSAIQDELDFEAFLGEVLWKEFASYRREDTLENQNYISDGLTNAEMFQNAMAFLDSAQREIYKSAESQHSIESDMHNLLTMEEFQPIVDCFCVGNWIHVGVDGTVYKLRLYSYDIDFDKMALDVVFTDLQRGKDTASDVSDLLGRVKSLASSYGAIARQAKITAQTKKAEEKAAQSGFASGTVSTGSGGWSDGLSLNGGVISGRVYNDNTEKYDGSQYKISQYGIFATDDGWANTKTVLGSHTDYNPITDTNEKSFGSIAERLEGNMLLSKRTGAFDKDGNVILSADGLELIADSASNTRSVTIKRKNGNNDFDTLFEVDANGKLIVTGEIHAEGGDAESFAIDNGKFTVDAAGNAAAGDIEITGGSIDLGDGNFAVDEDGEINAVSIDVEDDVSIGGDLGVTGAVEIGGTLNVTGKATLSGDAEVGGNIDIAGDTNITGDNTVGGDLGVTGVAEVGGTLNVTGKATLGGGADVTGDADIGGDLGVTGDAEIGGTLGVTGKATMSGGAEVVGNEDVSGDVSVGGDLAVTGAADIGGALDVTGKTTLSGGADVTGDTDVSGDVGIGGDLSVTGDSEVDGTLDVTGKATLSGGADVTGNAEISGDVITDGAMITHDIIAEIAATVNYGSKALYAFACTIPVFSDLGEDVLDANGDCTITIDPVFAELIETSGYQVFLQAYGNGSCYVSDRQGSYFVVSGTPGISFAWNIQAIRKGYSNVRLTPAANLIGNV